MIKGKYAATVIVDFNFDEAQDGLEPFDEMNREVHEEMTAVIKRILDEEFGEFGTVKVIKQYADLYRTEDE